MSIYCNAINKLLLSLLQVDQDARSNFDDVVAVVVLGTNMERIFYGNRRKFITRILYRSAGVFHLLGYISRDNLRHIDYASGR